MSERTIRDRSTFIEQFVASFCAAYMANNYARFCAAGWDDERRKPPTEDAFDLAQAAWADVVDKGFVETEGE